MAETLDLLIIGGYYGRGHLKGSVNHFLLGAAVNVSDDNILFYSTGRVGSGYSIKDLEDLSLKLKPYWKEAKNDRMPSSVKWGKEKPDVWIEPDKSYILEVNFFQVFNLNYFNIKYILL